MKDFDDDQDDDHDDDEHDATLGNKVNVVVTNHQASSSKNEYGALARSVISEAKERCGARNTSHVLLNVEIGIV